MGVCKAGVCACLNGYEGLDCSEPPCPGWKDGVQCSGHGTCGGGKCTCSGSHPDPFNEAKWTGEDCTTKTCPSGIAGVPNACSNHGTCDNSTGLCRCRSGWRGIGCQIRTC